MQNASKSIVGSLATHENDLLSQREASVEEARQIIEQAQSDARNHLQDSENALNEEVTEKRRAADAARQQKFQQTVDAALDNLSDVKASAIAKVPDVAKEVLALFMPKSSGGN